MNMNIYCGICQEHFSHASSLATTICGHVFHTDCIKKAFKYTAMCPYCRKPDNQIIPLYMERRQIEEDTVGKEINEQINEKDKKIEELKSLLRTLESDYMDLRKEHYGILRTAQTFKEVATQSKVLVVKYRKLRNLDTDKIADLEAENKTLNLVKSVLSTDVVDDNLESLNKKDLAAMISFFKESLKNKEKDIQKLNDQLKLSIRETDALKSRIDLMQEPLVERVDSVDSIDENSNCEITAPKPPILQIQTNPVAIKVGKGNKRMSDLCEQPILKLKKLRVVSDQAKLN